nr:glycosyltransferase family 39 protein [Verrucomicrobiota bacterium]
FRERGRRWVFSTPCVFVLLAVLVFPLVLSLGMAKKLSHDEHQHVAAGALLARQGWLPYKDFPHFHPPNLVFAYGLLFKTEMPLLLGARLVSVASAACIAGLAGALAFAAFAARGGRIALLAACGAIALCLTASVFTDTTGRAWNQELALLLTLFAFVAHLRGLEQRSRRWFITSGLLLGLAIGTRITYAPLLAPFGWMMLWPKAGNRSWRLIVPFSAGMIAGLGGLIYLCAAAPEGSLFGNLEFAKANVVYRYATGEPRTMTLLKKLRYLVKEVVRPDFALFIAAAFPAICVWRQRRRSGGPLPIELCFVLLILPFLLIGSFAPSPLFQQYFYPFVPFLILTALYALAALTEDSQCWSRRALATCAICCGVSVIIGGRAYDDLEDLVSIHKWTAMSVYREGEEIRSHVPEGRVLTLAPIQALEAGLGIYPSFSSGPFAWRVAPFVEPAKASRLRMMTPATLPGNLEAEPPAAILLGAEERGEDQLRDHATRQKYRLVNLSGGKQLWIRPPSTSAQRLPAADGANDR